MKKFSMMILAIVLVGLMAALSVTGFATEATAVPEDPSTASPEADETAASEDEMETPQRPEALYVPFSGEVQEIQSFYEADGSVREGTQYVLLKAADESLMRFVVNEDTLLLDDPVLEEGQQLLGFYDGNAPAILIYPPQMPALVLMPYDVDVQVSMALFDEEYLSADGKLQIVTDENTVILDARGEDYTDSLTGRTWVVTYGASTRSIPAQATAIRIVVLDEKAEEISSYQVDGEWIGGPAAYQDESGVWMVPVEPIAEALGMSLVADEAQEGTYQMGRAVSFTVGSTTYGYARMAPIELDTAPVEQDGVVYVPLDFFTEVVRLSEATVSEGGIIFTRGKESAE